MIPTNRGLALRVDLPSETMLLASGLPSEKQYLTWVKGHFVRFAMSGMALLFIAEFFLRWTHPKMGWHLRIR